MNERGTAAELDEIKSHLQRLKHSPTAIALIFSFALAAAEAFVFGQNYSGFFLDFSPFSFEDWRALFFVVFAFAALFFFVRSTLVSRFGWQCAYFGVFALALSVEYGFHGALGRFTLPSDLENTFYASDASDKIGAITLFFSWLIIAPLALYRWLFRFASDDAKNGARLFALNLLVLLIGFLATADFYRKPLPSNAFAAHFNNLTTSALYFGELKLTPRKRQTVAPLENAAPQNNVVFIVDESVRGDHLSINGYARQTTPTLERLQAENLLKNWGLSASGATESVGSNRLLVSGLANLPDRERRVFTLPTIFQYARAAGYKTFYFDGQGYADWIGSEADRADFGRIFTAQDFPNAAPFELDAAFAEKVREIVANSKGNFIWINKRGAHFRYEKNYPAEKTIWTPTDLTAEKDALETNQPLVNNYDNALFYNSEFFFGALLKEDLPPATVFVYTSDHGQTLVHNRATHAGDSRAEATVPLFIIGADERIQNADTDFAAAHRNIFATLLDLMNYPKEKRVAEYAPSLLEAEKSDSVPRQYAVGNLSGAFGGKQMNFDAPE